MSSVQRTGCLQSLTALDARGQGVNLLNDIVLMEALDETNGS